MNRETRKARRVALDGLRREMYTNRKLVLSEHMQQVVKLRCDIADKVEAAVMLGEDLSPIGQAATQAMAKITATRKTALAKIEVQYRANCQAVIDQFKALDHA